jgi:uncharacterized metal-binding protein YceD (DUF177 family)
MTKADSKPLWSLPVAVGDIPESGRRYDLVPDASLRTALAKLAGLRELASLKATFDVSRHGSRGLRVSGRVEATVGQTCSVTLEPMENKVDENVDVLFLPPSELFADDGTTAATETIDPDAPEPLIGDSIDLGAIATEFLLLGIDPYPRKRDAAFDPPAVEEDTSSHPFAALAALKKAKDEPNA